MTLKIVLIQTSSSLCLTFLKTEYIKKALSIQNTTPNSQDNFLKQALDRLQDILNFKSTIDNDYLRRMSYEPVQYAQDLKI